MSKLQAQRAACHQGAVEVRRAWRRLEDTVTDERVGLFTPDKDGHTHTSCGRVAVIVARRGTVSGEVGRVLRFPSTQHPHPLRFVGMLLAKEDTELTQNHSGW